MQVIQIIILTMPLLFLFKLHSQVSYSLYLDSWCVSVQVPYTARSHLMRVDRLINLWIYQQFLGVVLISKYLSKISAGFPLGPMACLVISYLLWKWCYIKKTRKSLVILIIFTLLLHSWGWLARLVILVAFRIHNWVKF